MNGNDDQIETMASLDATEELEKKPATAPDEFGTPKQSTPDSSLAGSQVAFIASTWEVKLDAMSVLKKGWNGYTADPPSPLAIEFARRFISNLESNGLPPTRVAPSVIGGVGVTRKVGNKRAYFEFYNDGTAHVMLAEGAEAQTFPLLNPTDVLVAARAYLNG
jgi:hypothetical protein